MARSHIITAVVTACLALFLFWQLAVNFNFSADNSPLIVSLGHDSNAQHHVLEDSEYLLGVGKADITGPVVEINMMGYADMDQNGSGLRQRLYCRAFIVGSISEPSARIVYLVLDTQSGDTAIRHGILEGLTGLGDNFAVYTKNNVAVTGTHSHSGPGAWLNYLLPQITSKGFDKSSYQAIVNGSLLAIRRAHESLVPGHLSLGSTDVESANSNRSPFAYEANPQEERSRYSSDVDKTMTILRFDRASDGKAMGMLSWFAVHGTSLYGNNTLISGDNKGVAAYLFERSMSSTHPGFVAGFSQANVGDTSPNILGAYCDDTGLPCRFNDSTCSGKIKTCHGRGPFWTIPDQGAKSCFEIGRRQSVAAQSLFNNPSSLRRLSGSASTVSSLHTYVNLTSYTFPSPFNASLIRSTCSAALGHSFAGGTTDGPGAFDFRQGDTDNSPDSPSQRNPLWKLARAFVHEPSAAQEACQSPKPILLDVGAADSPYAWTPNIVDIQLLRVGPLLMIISPGEATTMSGRRWRETLASAAPSVLGISDPVVVLGGPANTYTHYIATEQEYGIQRYEGASTLYGPHTLEAYINLTLSYLPYLGNSGTRDGLPPLPPGPQPPINTNRSLSFIRGVVLDTAPLFKRFGDVLASPQPPASRIYMPGESVSTRFVGANPRNNFRLEGTFAAVERLDTAGAGAGAGAKEEKWHVVRTDADWNLVFRWERKSTLLGTSEVRVEWEIEEGSQHRDHQGAAVLVEPGLYRMRYFGDAKALNGQITPFEGTGGVFRVGESGAGNANANAHADDLKTAKGRAAHFVKGRGQTGR
ncbi:hypothetical protein GJ744_002639 [Endocarpon pusillum]|uniref:Neutral ceramidase n=1 Tax=Endocarpon pusillum TaxID=364733 RepID=A0A8H7AFD2_9EURO|nr:hypothetical protein GJ744_002639 [Endocarpon pusillum]